MRTACPMCEPYYHGNETPHWRVCTLHTRQLDRSAQRTVTMTKEELARLRRELDIERARAVADACQCAWPLMHYRDGVDGRCDHRYDHRYDCPAIAVHDRYEFEIERVREACR